MYFIQFYEIKFASELWRVCCFLLVLQFKTSSMKLTAIILYNYGPLCRETSRFVNLRGKTTPPRVDKSGCFPTQRAVIVLLYFCQCFIGYLPCGGKLGCLAGNNRVVFRQHKFLPMFYRLSPLWGEIGLFGGEHLNYFIITWLI